MNFIIIRKKKNMIFGEIVQKHTKIMKTSIWVNIIFVEGEEHKKYVSFLNNELLKYQELKGQPQDVVKLQKNKHVRGLPSMSYKDDLLCEACQKGKQIENYFTSKNIVSTSRPLQLLHLDMFGPTRTASSSGKRYGLVIVDNYSRWTRVMFLKNKDKSFDIFFKFCKCVQNEKGVCITSIWCDHGENLKMTSFNWSMKKMESFTFFNIKNTSSK